MQIDWTQHAHRDTITNSCSFVGRLTYNWTATARVFTGRSVAGTPAWTICVSVGQKKMRTAGAESLGVLGAAESPGGAPVRSGDNGDRQV